MDVAPIRKIYRQGSSLVVVLPPQFTELVGLLRGDAVSISTVTGGEIVITPLRRYINSLPFKDRDKGIIKT